MKTSVQIGKQSITFEKPVYIMSAACIVGPKEGKDHLRIPLMWLWRMPPLVKTHGRKERAS